MTYWVSTNENIDEETLTQTNSRRGQPSSVPYGALATLYKCKINLAVWKHGETFAVTH